MTNQHQPLTVGPVACPPGERATGFVPAVERVDGTPLGFPVLIANGARPGPVLLVDGGIHGDEQEGTLAVAEFVNELDPGALTGAVVAVPLMNVGAFEAMARGNPRDTHSHDMNRIYPGNPSGYLTDRIAATHAETAAAVADIEITFHSGGNICYLGETIFTTSNDPLGLELAQAMGPDWTIVLDTPHPAGSPMAAMTPNGKPAITVELGGSAGTMPGVFRENVDILKRAIGNVCRHYGMLEGAAAFAPKLWRGRQNVLRASRSGILSPAAGEAGDHLKRPIRKGQTLLRIHDLLGNPVEDLNAPCDGVLFGFRTHPSTTAGDWTLFCGEAEFVAVEPPQSRKQRSREPGSAP